MTWPSRRMRPPEGPGQVRVNLGCGLDYRPGWINVDANPTGKLRVDRSFNLEDTPWPFGTSSVDYVLLNHVAEHLRHAPLLGLTRRLLRLMEAARSTGRWDDDQAHALESFAAKDGLILVMEEVHRMLKPGGLVDVVSPGPWTPDAWRDPTHARVLDPEFWTYFSADGLPTRQIYTGARFRFVRQETLRTLDHRWPFRWLGLKDYHAQKYLGPLGRALQRLGVKRWHITRLEAVKA